MSIYILRRGKMIDAIDWWCDKKKRYRDKIICWIGQHIRIKLTLRRVKLEISKDILKSHVYIFRLIQVNWQKCIIVENIILYNFIIVAKSHLP